MPLIRSNCLADVKDFVSTEQTADNIGVRLSLMEHAKAVIEVHQGTIANYFTKNVKIKGVSKLNGNRLFRHHMLEKHTTQFIIEEPGWYEIELLYERPLLLDFAFAKAEVEVKSGCRYRLDCARNKGDLCVDVDVFSLN